jgi:hypothetical protein
MMLGHPTLRPDVVRHVGHSVDLRGLFESAGASDASVVESATEVVAATVDVVVGATVVVEAVVDGTTVVGFCCTTEEMAGRESRAVGPPPSEHAARPASSAARTSTRIRIRPASDP